MTLNGVEYYYLRNGQNDIIGLVDKTGTQVVSYTYDSWGKLISIDGSLKSTVGAKNPYRYRGYRYDTETGLYYLNSRYYNPEWGRFINADIIVANTGDILGSNMYAYCKNNPVNMEDQDGDIPTMVVGALICVGVQLAADVIEGKFSGWGSLASAAFTGALGNFTGPMAIATRVIGGATIKQIIDSENRRENWNWKKFGQDIIDNVIGEGVATVSSGIISKYQYKKNYSQTANTLKQSGKYDGYNKTPVYKKLKSSTNIRINLGKVQNLSVSVGYSVVQSMY